MHISYQGWSVEIAKANRGKLLGLEVCLLQIRALIVNNYDYKQGVVRYSNDQFTSRCIS